ncbi:MAG TPA: hypothetical protein VNI77_07855, partial [Nitrososphaera sp.]|nr:hypothetical protein [Nitrososphaera sp.]
MQFNTVDNNRVQKLIVRATGISMLVLGMFLFLLVIFAGIAYPAVTQCVDYAYGYGQSQCREFGTRPVFLDPIMNETFSTAMIALAISGA